MSDTEALHHYEEEERERMLAGKKADPTEKIREGKGEAADHAARDFAQALREAGFLPRPNLD